jgi:hypothetical protein
MSVYQLGSSTSVKLTSILLDEVEPKMKGIDHLTNNLEANTPCWIFHATPPIDPSTEYGNL